MSGRKKTQPQVTSAMKEELLKWICIKHATNSQLDRNLLKQRAIELVRQFELTGLKCSESWLTVFLKRYGFSVTLNDCCGPVFDDYTIWVDMIRALINQYRYEDQYHVDELSMYTDFLPPPKLQPDEQPDHPVDMSALKLEVTTPAMYQTTILLACSAAGTEKQKPLVCGPYEVQENENFSYCQSKNSKISDELFGAWLFLLNHEMSRNNRSILLFMSRGRVNALKLVHLTHILPVFFPHNFPAYLRPIRGDIFHCIKMFYRESYVEKLCGSGENTQWQPQEIAENLTEAWRQVPKELIISRFQRTKFRQDDSLLSMECKFWQSLQTGVPFRHFVTFDDDLSDARGPLCGDLRFLTKVKQQYNLKTPTINLKTKPPQIDDAERLPGMSAGHASRTARPSDDYVDESFDCSDQQEESADLVTTPIIKRYEPRDNDEKDVSSSFVEPDKSPETRGAVEMSDECAKSSAGVADTTDNPPGGDSKVFESFKSLMDSSLPPQPLKAPSKSISIPRESAFSIEDVHKSLGGAQATQTSKQAEDTVGVEDSGAPQGITAPAIDCPTNTAVSVRLVSCKTEDITSPVKTSAAVELVNNSSEINSCSINSEIVSSCGYTSFTEKVAAKLSESTTVSFYTSSTPVDAFFSTVPVRTEARGSSSPISISTTNKNVDGRPVHASLTTEITGHPLDTWITNREVDNAQSDDSLASKTTTTDEQMQFSPSAVTYINSNRGNRNLVFPVTPESVNSTFVETAQCSEMLNSIRDSLPATSSGNSDADCMQNSMGVASKTSEIENIIVELKKSQLNISDIPKGSRYSKKQDMSLANSAQAPEVVDKSEITSIRTSDIVGKMKRSTDNTLENLRVFSDRSLSEEPSETLEAKNASLLYQRLIGTVASYPTTETPLQEASRELEKRLMNLEAGDSSRKLRDLLVDESTLESCRHSILRELLEDAKELTGNLDENVPYSVCNNSKRKRENDSEAGSSGETGEPEAKKQMVPDNWAKCFENYPVFGPYDINESTQDTKIDENNYSTELQANTTERQSPSKKERSIFTCSEDSPRPSCSYDKC